MLLAVDVGNTNICFAVYDGEKQVKQWRVETGQVERIEVDGIKDVIVCSVVPDANDALKNVCEKQFDITPTFVTHENVDIEINIDKPAQMGADRMVGASAAVAHYQAPCIIVDFGTATTFDVIDGQGCHQGGVISSGVNLSLKALEQAAAQLPDIKVEAPNQVIGKNTNDAMQSGIYWGYISMVEGVVARIAKEMQVARPYVIATGGLAPLFERGTDIFDAIDQDLIMKGLVHMHKVLKQGKETL